MRKIDPIYPDLAQKSRISGVVVLDVVVDEEGGVSEVRYISGPALLRDSAINAVRQWRYSPTLLNGEPIPVTSQVRVTFRLN